MVCSLGHLKDTEFLTLTEVTGLSAGYTTQQGGALEQRIGRSLYPSLCRHLAGLC